MPVLCAVSHGSLGHNPHFTSATNKYHQLKYLDIFLTSPFVSPDAPPPTWEQLEKGLVAVKTVVHGLVDFIQNHSKKGADPQQVSLFIGPQKELEPHLLYVA